MKRSVYLYIVLAGIIAGFALGFYLKIIELLFSIKVYTLLLNIDFIPWLDSIAFPEWLEFTFHLAVSLTIACVIWAIGTRLSWKTYTIKTAAISVLISLIIYPITLLSERTPPIDSAVAISWWVSGHIIFGILLGWIFSFIARNLN